MKPGEFQGTLVSCPGNVIETTDRDEFAEAIAVRGAFTPISAPTQAQVLRSVAPLRRFKLHETERRWLGATVRVGRGPRVCPEDCPNTLGTVTSLAPADPRYNDRVWVLLSCGHWVSPYTSELTRVPA